jgi:hypothetical protein
MDAFGLGSWHQKGDAIETARGRFVPVTSGFVFYEDENVIAVAQTQGAEGQVHNIIMIPRATLIERRTVEC